MQVIRSKRGTGLVDVILTLFLLGVVGAIFSATFPIGITCSRQAQDYKTATALAQRKMEQLRAKDYQSLTQPLMAGSIIDADSETSPYSFTSIDNIADQLSAGTGEIEIEDVASDTKSVRVIVRWRGSAAPTARIVQLTTLIVDKRTRRVN